MQDTPLTLVSAFGRAERLFADKQIHTGTPKGTETMTYGEWAQRTRRLAAVLDELGVSGDGRVGTFGWNTARHLELYYAAPCSGRVLHTLNPRLFPEQLVYVANHAEDEVVFADRSLLGVLWEHIDEMKNVKYVVVMDDGADEEIPDDERIRDYEELLDAAEPVDGFRVEDENQAAAMCYTSGTTGNPKGVVYTHRSMTLHAITTMLADTFALSENDVVMPVVPMFHVNAWGLPHASVMTGASLVLPGADLSPDALIKLVEEHKVTLTAGVPTIWMGVLPKLKDHDFSSVTRLVCGGSAVPRALSESYREETGRPILQAWGMTETSPIGSIARIKSTVADRSEDELADIRASVGLLSPLLEARIVEGESTEPLPWDGEAQGELQISGPWIAATYYDDERAADSFTPDGWLRTGDVATIDEEGYIRIVDRTKDVIKSGGEWVSSVELENAIMADERVAEAAVIAVPDEKWGERPMACIVLEDGAELEDDDVKEFLAERVAKWWIPERIEFIDEVPKTSVGKFSKKTLRERFVESSEG